MITFLIVIHEIGHLLLAYLLGGEVLKIYIYPLGGISKFRFDLNISIFKEFLILIFGPIFQFIAYYILINILKDYYSLITAYHYGILFFNLLPIYPLDGGKIVNLLLSVFISYKNSLFYTIFISFIMLMILLITGFFYNYLTLNFIVIILFLLYKMIFEYRQINFLYERFLLERYLNRYNFKRSSIVFDIDSFKRDRRHLVKIDDKYYLEHDLLEKKYKNH